MFQTPGVIADLVFLPINLIFFDDKFTEVIVDDVFPWWLEPLNFSILHVGLDPIDRMSDLEADPVNKDGDLQLIEMFDFLDGESWLTHDRCGSYALSLALSNGPMSMSSEAILAGIH